MVLLCSCTTIEIQAPKAGTVSVNADKTLTSNPALTASPSGNTVPVTSVP
jgi:hypothetical protein